MRLAAALGVARATAMAISSSSAFLAKGLLGKSLTILSKSSWAEDTGAERALAAHIGEPASALELTGEFSAMIKKKSTRKFLFILNRAAVIGLRQLLV